MESRGPRAGSFDEIGHWGLSATGVDSPGFGLAVCTAGAMLLIGGSLASGLAIAVASGVAGPGEHWRVSAFIASALAAAFGAVLLLLGRRTPIRTLYMVPVFTAVLICTPPLVSHQSTPFSAFLLVWPTLYAGYLLPERAAWVTLGVSLVLLAAVALRIQKADAVASCVEIGASLVVTLYVTLRLRRRNRALVHLLRSEARTDPLTGLANRRAFNDMLEREFAQYERRGDPLSLLAIDVDHFKSLNDRAGHPAGDAALAALAGVLTGQARRGDVVARTGGEEFAILMADCPTDTAQHRARALRAAVLAESANWPNPITISIGVATLPDHAGSSAELVTAADGGLYAAKAAGRDTVATA